MLHSWETPIRGSPGIILHAQGVVKLPLVIARTFSFNSSANPFNLQAFALTPEKSLPALAIGFQVHD
ncbi:hypothetical protein Hypma_002738 [Hypsizygus marmoreus]|uniref:Uncharacterized protein n=1 Tax=Hypsizygus marmoreus TaxID=39966 RepID=A0A369J306_HYPMA|nr:hypothetical protein Hypma_002738 [Hypsizygus marmoreus]